MKSVVASTCKQYKLISTLFMAVSSIILLQGCTSDNPNMGKEKQDAGFDPGKTVAQINGEQISQEFFDEYYIRTISRMGKNDTPQQRYRELNELINSILLKQEAQQRGLKDSAYQRYREVVTDKALNRMLIKKQVYDSLPPINEAQLRTAFLRANKDLYIRQLYFRDEDKARHYHKRLETGEDFIDLANELYHPHSSQYDSSAGYIGKVSYFNVDDAFAEAAWSLPPQQHSEPVRTRLGYYILRVENMDYNPIITEDKYEERKSAIEYMVKERIYNLEADEFIRNKMAGKQVEPFAGNIGRLHEAIQQVPGYRPELRKKKQKASYRDAQLVATRLRPQTVLARYNKDGQTNTFTAADYVKWLPHLPFGEARSRTTASVGRALRFHTFAREAEALGYGQDEAVRFEQNFLTSFYLSGRMSELLNRAPVPDFPEDTLRRYYQVMNFDKVSSIPANYWTAEAPTRQQAERMLQDIKENGKDPAGFDTYQRFRQVDLLEDSPFHAHLRRLQEPMTSVMNIGDGKWYVFGLEEITRNRQTFAEAKEQVRKVLKHGYAEVKLLKELRKEAEIQVDTTAFEDLMGYYGPRDELASSTPESSQ